MEKQKLTKKEMVQIAEEKEIHNNWLREKGSWIQAIKDAKSGYTEMSNKQREQGEEERIQKVKDAIKDKKLRARERAVRYGGLKEDEFQKQPRRSGNSDPTEKTKSIPAEPQRTASDIKKMLED